MAQVTPERLLALVRERYSAKTNYELAEMRGIPWSYNQINRWANTGKKDGPNFWHTIELLERAGMLSRDGAENDEPQSPLDPTLALQELEDAVARLIPILREALLPPTQASQAGQAR
jgi:hypothetical protein